jgi:hypothetical protein
LFSRDRARKARPALSSGWHIIGRMPPNRKEFLETEQF